MVRKKSIKKQIEEEKTFDMVDQSNKPVDKDVQEEPVDISDKFVEIKKEKPEQNKCEYFGYKGKTYKKVNDRIAVCCSDGTVIDMLKGE